MEKDKHFFVEDDVLARYGIKDTDIHSDPEKKDNKNVDIRLILLSLFILILVIIATGYQNHRLTEGYNKLAEEYNNCTKSCVPIGEFDTQPQPILNKLYLNSSKLEIKDE